MKPDSVRTKHGFDMVDGTQEVFRLLLDALANPGRPVDLSVQINQFATNGCWLAPALTLLDNETGFYWDGLPEVSEEIRFLSGAAQVPLEKADFVFIDTNFITRSEITHVFSLIKSGTHRDPHDSALVFIAAGGKADQSITIKGPGVPPEGRNVPLSAAEADWVKARDALCFEYPCGVEMVFLREDNSLLAVTRKAVVTWPM
ncbi:MAG: phosphonate C-P lyase system protein PhnH [Treponema sp.]|nr:phosphonate C-P lyase system protein PhnH [Treponema sp.]